MLNESEYEWNGNVRVCRKNFLMRYFPFSFYLVLSSLSICKFNDMQLEYKMRNKKSFKLYIYSFKSLRFAWSVEHRIPNTQFCLIERYQNKIISTRCTYAERKKSLFNTICRVADGCDCLLLCTQYSQSQFFRCRSIIITFYKNVLKSFCWYLIKFNLLDKKKGPGNSQYILHSIF